MTHPDMNCELLTASLDALETCIINNIQPGQVLQKDSATGITVNATRIPVHGNTSWKNWETR